MGHAITLPWPCGAVDRQSADTRLLFVCLFVDPSTSDPACLLLIVASFLVIQACFVQLSNVHIFAPFLSLSRIPPWINPE